MVYSGDVRVQLEANVWSVIEDSELQRRADFENDAPVTEERKVVSESRETTFDVDIASLPELETILERLVAVR